MYIYIYYIILSFSYAVRTICRVRSKKITRRIKCASVQYKYFIPSKVTFQCIYKLTRESKVQVKVFGLWQVARCHVHTRTYSDTYIYNIYMYIYI